MADIELVIKIPEELVNELYDDNYEGVISWYDTTLYRAIQDGTPLPKGHGRLIDADELKKHKYHDNDRFENAVAIAQIDWADTIIEADKGENNGT